ncbi:long-chain fatty acid transport protein 1-like [Arctopsyche grandis]|uniref:long-chain fatty acid transport protein 1-like n=1 Tax=Arctopsyche grandis TaxID=121162 RepID=UPI00406D7C80
MKHVKLLQYNIDVNIPMLKNAECIVSKLEIMPTIPLTSEMNESSGSDHFLYIYTSGTTGLPKAAIVTHMRFLLASTTVDKLLNMNENDVLYNPLPLHHTSGSCIGIGLGLVFGTSVVIRNKFSVSHFWTDCIKYKCTVALYIGEICRFLLNAAEKSGKNDSMSQHRIRAMIGNGLRSTLWKPFQQTFNITNIYEFYASTEGNANMVNITSKEGALGFIPRFLSFVSPIKVIKCDKLTGEPLRDPNGYCIECKPCEAGLLIGKIIQQNNIITFKGYLDKESTNKKLLHNVLKSGDVYFNTGDILVMDDFGYYYFKDRTGDTFRWRGENVSTTEVENVIQKVIGLDVIIYGVSIPNVEGKAGMAAIANVDGKLDFNNLLKDLKKILPRYAIPIFIRIVSNVPITVTFKLIKTNMQKEAFDINHIEDKVYFLDDGSSTYVPLTPDLYSDIISGKIRF